jgi:hypothetical protein
MEESLNNLVNQIFAFFTTHFYEILLVILVLAILDVVVYIFASNKRDKVIILHSSCLTRQVFRKLTFL